jgi:hypothetical protein
MKTTIDIDEKKLATVMSLLFKKALPDKAYISSLDPAYDLTALRAKDRTKHHVAH